MKSKVVSRFNDRETGTHYEAGDTFECSPERFAELEEKGFVKKEVRKKDEL